MTVQELINELYKFNSDREIDLALYYEVPNDVNRKGFHSFETSVKPLEYVRLVKEKVRLEYGSLAEITGLT